MTAHQLARALTVRARYEPDPDELVEFAVAQITARRCPARRVILAARLVWVALTGRKSW